MKNRAFTLIELLAVIIILGILMLIAIPSVTSYINNSRKSTYVTTVNELVKATVSKVNSGDLNMFDTDTTYYVPCTCIKLENGEAKSPYGKFDPAYVVVTFDGTNYNYYFTGKDIQNMGVPVLTSSDMLSKESIVANVEAIDTTIGIEGRSSITIFNEDCSDIEATNPAGETIPGGSSGEGGNSGEDPGNGGNSGNGGSGSGGNTPEPMYFAFGKPTTSSTTDHTAVRATHGISGGSVHPRVFATLYDDNTSYGLCLDYINKLICFRGGNNGQYVTESRTKAKSELISSDAGFNNSIDSGSQTMLDDRNGTSSDVRFSSNGYIEIYADNLNADEPFLCSISKDSAINCHFEW